MVELKVGDIVTFRPDVTIPSPGVGRPDICWNLLDDYNRGIRFWKVRYGPGYRFEQPTLNSLDGILRGSCGQTTLMIATELAQLIYG